MSWFPEYSALDEAGEIESIFFPEDFDPGPGQIVIRYRGAGYVKNPNPQIYEDKDGNQTTLQQWRRLAGGRR